jgi:hypothetical protein
LERDQGPEAKREYMAELGRRGARAFHAARRKTGLDPDDLPTLNSPEDAERWLELVARAVVTGQLANRDGQVAVQAVREWLKAHDAGRMGKKVAQLQDQLEALKGPHRATSGRAS